MQEWTRWFREKQSAFGTIEEFARESGIGVRSVADYRAGRIPRATAREKITAVLGEPGPLPGTPTERAVTLEERIDQLHAEFVADRERHDVLRAELVDLIHRVASGEPFVLTEDDRVALLRSAEVLSKRPGAGARPRGAGRRRQR